MSGAVAGAIQRRPLSTAWEASHTLAADMIQQPIVRAVSIKWTNFMELNEWGRRDLEVPGDPLPATASHE